MAVGIHQPGSHEVVAVIDRPVREPGENEVRIAVAAAAVNPTDTGLRERGGGDLPAPWTPGMAPRARSNRSVRALSAWLSATGSWPR